VVLVDDRLAEAEVVGDEAAEEDDAPAEADGVPAVVPADAPVYPSLGRAHNLEPRLKDSQLQKATKVSRTIFWLTK